MQQQQMQLQQPQQPAMMHNGPSAQARTDPKFEMKPIATSETKQEQRRTGSRHQTGNGNNFELENLDISPGNTLRDRRRLEDLHSPTSPAPEVVEVLQESPGASRNRRKAQDYQQVPLTFKLI